MTATKKTCPSHALGPLIKVQRRRQRSYRVSLWLCLHQSKLVISLPHTAPASHISINKRLHIRRSVGLLHCIRHRCETLCHCLVQQSHPSSSPLHDMLSGRNTRRKTPAKPYQDADGHQHISVLPNLLKPNLPILRGTPSARRQYSYGAAVEPQGMPETTLGKVRWSISPRPSRTTMTERQPK